MNTLTNNHEVNAGGQQASPLLRAGSALAAKASARWQPIAKHINGLALKERALLLFAGLALVAALEWLAVRPMVAKAQLVAEAGAQAEQAAADEMARLVAERSAESERWRVELEELQARLAAECAGAPGDEKLALVLKRALSAQRVAVLGLRGLGAEEVVLEKSEGEDPAAGATATSVGDTPGALPAGVSRSLYRHRFELVLGGKPGELTRAISALDPSLRPLRIERARLATTDSGELRATLTLVVLAKEKQWLVL